MSVWNTTEHFAIGIKIQEIQIYPKSEFFLIKYNLVFHYTHTHTYALLVNSGG